MLAPLFQTATASGTPDNPAEVSGTITRWAVERAVAWRTAGNDEPDDAVGALIEKDDFRANSIGLVSVEVGSGKFYIDYSAESGIFRLH